MFEISIDPTDFTRLRFVIVMQNFRGEMRRLRLVQWNDPNVKYWRNIGKEDSAALGGPESRWDQVLIDAVDWMKPKEVEKLLGKHRS